MLGGLQAVKKYLTKSLVKKSQAVGAVLSQSLALVFVNDFTQPLQHPSQYVFTRVHLLPISLGAIIRPNSHRWQSLPPSGLYRGLGAVHHCNTKWPTDAAPLHVANQLAKLSRIHNVS